MLNPRVLPPEGVKALQDAACAAIGHVQEYCTSEADRLSDIYTGREKGGTLLMNRLPPGGIPMDQYVTELRAGVYNTSSNVLNLLTSRLVQIFVASTPGRPTIVATPKNGAAARLAEQQDDLTDLWVEGSRMEDAVRRAAWLDPVQSHVGVRLCRNQHSTGPYDAICWQVIEANDCGVEPFSRRFTWHARVEQWGSLDAPLRKRIMDSLPKNANEPHPWEAVALTELFDTAFALEDGDDKRKGCRVHIFVNIGGKFYKDKRNKKPDLGNYVVTHDVRCAPLYVSANMQPAANEDVSPVEAAQWVGILDLISDLIEQVRRESMSNNMFVYDADRLDKEMMKLVFDQPPGRQIGIPVTGTHETRGIDSTLRPVERNSLLGELLTSLQTALSLLDDATGVGPQDRGLSINPSKSATEASVLSASSSRRTAARLNTQANRWEEMARIVFEYQREIFGKVVEVAMDGFVRTLPVPSPDQARFGYKVSLDEMENLSRRGRLDTQMMMHTIITRDNATFVQGVPKMVRESQRRLLKAAGWTDIDNYLERPVIESGPVDRYIAALETGKDIVVLESDDHGAALAYYGPILEKAIASGDAGIPVASLVNAMQRHQMFLKKRDAAGIVNSGNPSPVPGMSAQGEMDNQVKQQVQAGLPPQMSPQILGQ